MTYLDRRGEDPEALNELCDWPTEFLRDPSSWLEAEKMEMLLTDIDRKFGRQGAESLMEAVGHASKDLRSWGVLDSVLRMVHTPKDLFSQPERLFSYFISPAPPIGEMRRESESVNFVLPVAEVQFPMVTTYLRAAFEALPTYINKPMAIVVWDNSRVRISWSENQASLFTEGQDADLTLHPELLRNILHNLETSQKELEAMKLALIDRDQMVEKLSKQLNEALTLAASTPAKNSKTENREVAPEFETRLANTLHDLFRLGDYFARGQQLITLLIGQGRATPQVKEAMRRVDWDFVAIEGPQTVRRAVDELQTLVESSRNSTRAREQVSPRPAQKTFDELSTSH